MKMPLDTFERLRDVKAHLAAAGEPGAGLCLEAVERRYCRKVPSAIARYAPWAAVLVVLFCSASRAEAAPAAGARLDDETRVESRLLAPCCWTQTLDTHESDSARALRREIHARLEHGESPGAIEDDFAERFGERIRAVPSRRDPGAWIAAVVGSLMLALGVALILMIRRWLLREAVHARAAPEISPAADEYDARLEEELRHFDAR